MFPIIPAISDDTQLTLATCEAIVLSQGKVQPERIAARFRDWFERGRVVGVGSATLKALRDLSSGAHWALAGARGEFAAGAGPAMRAAPLAFFLDPSSEGDRRTLRDVCRITHHSDEAYAGALAVVAAVRRSAQGAAVPEQLLQRVTEELPDTAVRDRLEELARFSGTPAEAARRYGNSGYVVEAASLALFVAAGARGSAIEDVIRTAVSLGGDTDTIAAIAAQITAASGAPVPPELVQKVPDLIAAIPLIDDLAALLTPKRR